MIKFPFVTGIEQIMNGNEIRRRFIEYFEKRGHKNVHSSPLLPANDPTLLFVNAGMNQFKDVFLGNDRREYTRAVSSQKCIRAGGKHNDLDEVGKTARHHTFFEMLGNFSFGDYFKEDAITYAWDLLTGSIEDGKLGLDSKYLWFTYFEGDENVPADNEARDLWIKMGADPSRVLPFDAKDNFWQMGDTGPCGPCSEIHYYMGDEPDNPEKNRAEFVNAETGDDTIEIWNLVFMQFDKDENEKLNDLPSPSVDTGAGLERLAAVLQGESTNYHSDLIKPIIDFVCELSGKTYSHDSPEGFAMRVIADHARTTAFAIADGIVPGNEGRNYVLRKIMRRAIYHGREHLGFDALFFHKVCDVVVEKMQAAFPELAVQRKFIGKMVRLEEERFGNTLTVGLKKLGELSGDISWRDLAKLKDTFGIPIDLMFLRLYDQKSLVDNYELTLGEPENRRLPNGKPEELLKSINLEIFSDGISKEIEELQNSSAIGKTEQNEKINPIYKTLEDESIGSTFLGYETTKAENAKVIAIVSNDEKVDELSEDEEGLIVLDKTPFYAEAGGQVGDRGTLVSTAYGSGQLNANGSDDDVKPSATADGTDGKVDESLARFSQIAVFDTFAPIGGITLHKSKVTSGSLKVGDTVTATVDVEKRDAIRRNHTATHLVHAALKEILGTHVKQGGSVVAPDFLRFDFTHYQALTKTEIKEVKDLVNKYILGNSPVSTNIMSIDEAKNSGAVALFGEKYGSEVRVLSVGDGVFSKELCGGTHVSATGDIGFFKITSDEAIASGVRRIRAVTGFDAFKRFREDEKLIDDALGVLNTQRDQLPNAIAKLQEELKTTRKENSALKLKIATGAAGGSSSADTEVKEINGVNVVAKLVEDLDKGGMRHLSDTLMAKIKSGVVIIANRGEEKVSFIVRVSDDLTDKLRAGDIVKELATIVGGKGGGKPDIAEGGGSEPEKLSEALDASYGIIEGMMK